jgi:lysophospholipase L1-like esterase
MIKSRTCMLILLSSAALLNARTKQPDDTGPNRWEKTIGSFEEWDSKNSFASNGVLFVGSSSIRLWATRECFPEFTVINRGFGGSQISDVNYFAHRIVLPYKPKVIILYAGDNDIADGKSPQRVFDDFRKFVKLIHTSLPETRIIFISIKPSLSRWSLWPRMKEANLMVKKFTEKDRRLTFVDAETVLLGSNGKPDEIYYLNDNLHLNSKGYEVWTKLLRPMIEKELKSD